MDEKRQSSDYNSNYNYLDDNSNYNSDYNFSNFNPSNEQNQYDLEINIELQFLEF